MKTFTLTKDHINLLSKMWVSWEDAEFGAPSIDPKRPYGNSGSEIYRDMRKALGVDLPECPHCKEVLGETNNKDLDDLHKELETALQIVLRTKAFEPGEYIADDYSSNWRCVE